MAKLTKEDEALIIALAKDGFSASRIAVKFCVKSKMIALICEEAGVKVKYNKRGRDNSELIEMIKSERYTAAYIAMTLSICAGTVRAAQRELRLTYSDKIKKRNAKVKKITALRTDGMSTREACEVIGMHVSSYNRLKALV